MQDEKNTRPEHIEPEQMLDYLGNYVKKLMDYNQHTEEIAPLLEIYFKQSRLCSTKQV